MTTEEKITSAHIPSWDLGDLYQGLDDPCLSADQTRLQDAIQEFEHRYQGRLEQVIAQPVEMGQALSEFAHIQALSHNLMTYAMLLWSVNTQAEDIQTFKDQITRQVSEWGTRVEFFRQALIHLHENQLELLLQEPSVQKYASFLRKARLFQPYLLSEGEERILQLTKQYSRQRWLDFYTQSTSTWLFTVEGREQTEDEAMDYLRKADPKMRRVAYEEVFNCYRSQDQFIAYIFNTLIQEYALEARLRGFASTLDQQAFEQELKAAQVTHLLDEVRERLPLFQRYYALLQTQLGLDEIRSCDLTAPMRSTDWQVDWEKGQGIILAALEPLGEELQSKTAEFFAQNWIHAQPLRGKSSGAFCAPTADQHPYILMNWNHNLYALTALAHELGHGLHFYETVAEQHVLHLMPPLFLAETASTLNEYFLADHLIQNDSDPRSQQYFLSDLLQRFMNGLFRQSQISEFEVFVHREGAQRQLGAEELHAKWLELARGRGGDVIRILDAEGAGWSRIPHIFMYPFYCFNYTLSNLIVLALIHQYQHDRPDFLRRFRLFLRAGGGASPKELLELLQLDLDHPDFYRKAFAVLEDLIAQLETLMKSGQANERG